MGLRYAPSHKSYVSQKQSRNRIFACDTLSHNFPFYLIPCRIIFLPITIPCHIILSAKGHSVERHIPSSHVQEYPSRTASQYFNRLLRIYKGLLARSLAVASLSFFPISDKPCRRESNLIPCYSDNKDFY